MKRRDKEIDAEVAQVVEDDDNHERELTCWEKIEAFYNAPKITFLMNTVSETLFVYNRTYEKGL